MTALPAKTTFYLILEGLLTGILIANLYLIWPPARPLEWLLIGAVSAVLVKSLVMAILWRPIVTSLEQAVIIHQILDEGD